MARTTRINYSALIASLENMPAPSEASIKDPTEQNDEVQEVNQANDMVGAKPEGNPVTGLDSEARRKLGETGTDPAPQDAAKVNDKTMGTDAAVDQTANEGKSGKAPEGVTVKTGEFDPARPAQENIVEPEGESVIPSQTVGGEPEAADIEAAADSMVEDSAQDQILTEADETADDLARFETVAEALEKYQGILKRGIAARGYVSSETAEAIKAGLEAFSGELFGRTVPGLESFRHPVDRVTVSNELMDNLKEAASTTGSYMVEALKKLWQLCQDLWASVTQDAGELMQRLDALEQNANNVGKANKDKMAIKGAARLTINGQFSAAKTEGLKALREVAQDVLINWPGSLAKTLNEASRTQPSQSNNDDAAANGGSALAKAWAQVINGGVQREFKSVKPIPDGQTPSDMEGFDLVYRSPLLPGDYALFVGQSSDKTATQDLAEKGIKLVVQRVDGAEAGNQGEFVVDVPNPAEMKGMIKALREILDSIVKRDEARKELKSLGNVVNHLGGGIKIMGLLGGDGESYDVGKAIQTSAGEMLKANRAFTGYLFNTVKMHIAVLESFVGHHAGTNEKPQE